MSHIVLRAGSALAAILMILPVSVAEVRGQTLAPLEGAWDAYESVGGGRTRSFGAGETWLVFRGDKLISRNFAGVGEHTVAFTTNPKASPPRLEYTNDKGGKILAVYQLEGDNLTIAVSFGSEWPKGFTESAQSFRVSILKLKRRRLHR